MTPRKKRYCFRRGDDLLLLRTVLGERSLFSVKRSRRSKGWGLISAELLRQGVTATSHALRCRLRRLVCIFQEEVAQGKREDDFTEVEQLLDRFIQAETQFQERKTGGGSSGQEPSESRRSSDVESEESDVDDETLPTPAQSTPESGKKRKKRFFFQDLHDVLLLDAVLHDEGIVTVSGVRKPDWKTITASLNGQGLDVDAHTLRSHLRLLVDGYRTESSAWDADPEPLSEKYELLRDYCRKLDGEEDHHRPSNDDQAFDPALETQDRCVETSQEIRVGTKRSHAVTGSVESVECPRTPASPTVVTSNISQDRNAPFQPAEAASTPTIIQSPPHDSTGASEAAWKRQKVELENILERFVSQQADRQREEREQAQVRLSTQQDLQRQTIDLQKRALDMQEKAMNMQERLMALMEKIMDKLG